MAYKIFDGGMRYNIADFAVVGRVFTLSTDEEEHTLVGEPFYASCGALFDDGVFKTVDVNGKKVLTTIDTDTTDSYVAASCSLLFDADVFEIGDDGELMLA